MDNSQIVKQFFAALRKEKILDNNIYIPEREIISDGHPHSFLNGSITYTLSEDHGSVMTYPNSESTCSYTLKRTDYGFEIEKTVNPVRTFNELLIRGGDCLTQIGCTSWMIKNFIPRAKSLTGVIGKSGSGKTYVVLDWALSIAIGEKYWNGHKVNNGKVLYLCAEGQSGINARITVWCQEHGGLEKNRPLLNKNFLRSSMGLKLDIEEAFNKLTENLSRLRFIPDLVIIDTLNRFMSGDENSQKDATSFIDACDKLASRYNCAVIIVHHIGYAPSAQNRARGSSVFYASLDFEYLVSLDGDKVSISQSKVKDGERQQTQYLQFVSHDVSDWVDEDGEPIKSSVLIPSTPPVIEKSKVQIEDETICLKAFEKHGYLDENEEICITKENFKEFYISYLTEKDGTKPDPKVVSRNINPKQEGRLIGRLTRNYFIAGILDEKEDVTGWILTDDMAYASCRETILSRK